MIPFEHSNPREERDHNLIVRYVVASATLDLNGYRDWIEEECVDLLQSAHAAEELAGEETRKLIHRTVLRINDIQLNECPDCTRDLDDRISDISNGAYDNVVDARKTIDEPRLISDNYFCR